MKFIIVLLVVLSASPGVALGQGVLHPPPPQCKAPPHHSHKAKHSHSQCVAGSVTGVSGKGMTVQPPHGQPVKIVFIDQTVFQTGSGPGTLEGIMPGDFACVTGTTHGHTFTAEKVVFDLTPFHCSVKKPPPQAKS